MISRFQAHNYRVLGEISCELGPFSLVVGPNGSGKSSVLEALEMAVALRGDGALSQLRGRAGGSWSIAFDRADGDVWTRKLFVNDASALIASWDAKSGILLTDEVATQMPGFPRQCLRPRFDVAQLRSPSSVSQPRNTMAPNGVGLASTLADWKLEDDPRFELVNAQLRRIVPEVHAVLPQREGSQYQLRFRVGPRSAEVPAVDMSDGTLFALGFLTLLHSAGDGHVLLLMDDLDQDLHPRAQEALLMSLRETMTVRKDIQVVATCHSPYLVDHVAAEDVRVMTLATDGLACMRRLTEHPEYATWRERMRPGEFWASVGEDWVSARGVHGAAP